MARANLLYDPIYGPIHLDPFENEISRLPVMRRLRDISQMGLTHLVFPAARHDRFTHSVGVLSIVTKMFEVLRPSFDNDKVDDLRRVARVAALLHDVGHYPLSHTIEKAYAEVAREADYRSGWIGYRPSTDPFEEFVKFGFKTVTRSSPASEAHHENLGKQIVLSPALASRLCDEGLDPRVIAAVITGDDSSLEEDTIICGQLLHSELDADRIDYLRRDATFSATCYGFFDVDFLLESLEQKGGIVGINPKGLRAAEQFMFARLFAYIQIVFHKWVMAYEYMAKEVYKWLIRQGLVYSRSDLTTHALNGSDEFLAFTDHYFFSKLFSYRSEMDHPYDAWTRLILTGKRPELALEQEIVGTSVRDVKDKILNSPVAAKWEEIADSMNEDRWCFVTCGGVRLSDCAGPHPKPLDHNYRLSLNREGVVVFCPEHKPHLLLNWKHSFVRSTMGLTYAVVRVYCDSEDYAKTIRKCVGISPDSPVVY